MAEPAPTSARRPAALGRVAAILASLVLVPAVAYALWDFIESERVAARLDSAYPWIDTPDGRQPQVPAATPDEQAAGALYLEAGRLAAQSGGRPFLETARIIEALARLPAPQPARDPRFDELRLSEAPFAPALAALDRAAARSSIPLVADLRMLDLRRVASANAIRIARLALSGDPAAAAALTSTLRLHRIATSPVFLLRTVHSLELVLQFARPSEAVLADLQRHYAAAEPVHALEDHLEAIRNQVVRAAAPDDFGSTAPSLARSPVDDALFRLSRPIRNHRLAAEFDRFSDAIAAGRLAWPKNLEAAERLGRQYGMPRPFGPRRPSYLDMATPWRDAAIGELARVAPLVAEHLSLARSSIAAIAIERYRLSHGGALPDSLAALVPAYLPAPPEDPFTGSELHYRKDSASYAVYSVGVNRVDDGGAREDVSDLQVTRRGNPADVGIAVKISPAR